MSNLDYGARCWSGPGPGLLGARHQLAGPCRGEVFEQSSEAAWLEGRLLVIPL